MGGIGDAVLSAADGLAHLKRALGARFSPADAADLAVLLSCACRSDTIVYGEIPIGAPAKDETILLAYEERLLLPMKSIRGSAWEDRILTYSEDERYHVPPVVRILVHGAQQTARWDPEWACREALTAVGERAVPQVLRLLAELRSVPPQGIEAGIMQAVCTRLGFELDLHDVLDHGVRCGIMSPRTQRSLHTGLAKYELNPSVTWQS